MTLHRLAPLARYIAWAAIGAGALVGGLTSAALVYLTTKPKEK